MLKLHFGKNLYGKTSPVYGNATSFTNYHKKQLI